MGGLLKSEALGHERMSVLASVEFRKERKGRQVRTRKLLRMAFLAIAMVSSVGVDPVSATGNVTDEIVFKGVATVTKETGDGNFDFVWQGETCKIASGATVEDCTTSLSNATVTTSSPCPGVTAVKGTVTITRSSGTDTIQGDMTSTNIFGIGTISGLGISRGGQPGYTASGAQASTFKGSNPSPPPAENPCTASPGVVYWFDAEGVITISN